MANVLNYETPETSGSITSRARRALGRGPLRVLKGGVEYGLWLVRKTWQSAWFAGYGIVRQAIPTRKGFRLGGTWYRYFYHKYGVTWRNERAVEVPVARAFLEAHRGKRVLEFGNVLGHYLKPAHDVLDKYETASGVINQDVVDYRAEPYDAIVGVSTLEHVGWDENDRRPEKLLDAVDSLQRLLKPGGTMFLTIPVGYNPFLDHYIETGRVAFDEVRCLRRVSRFGDWEEAAYDDVKRLQYDKPYPSANAVLFATIRA